MNKLLFDSLQAVVGKDSGCGGCSLYLSSKRSNSSSTRPELVVEIQFLLRVSLQCKQRVSGYFT